MSTPASSPEPLWSIDQLAAYLGCSVRHVYRLTSERRIVFLRVGKELRFDPADVRAYVAAQKITVAPTKPVPPPRPVHSRPRARKVA